MMRMKIILLILICLIVVSAISCSLETNTSDPQASKDIENSKKDGFFISQYASPLPPLNIFAISEAWVESVWFNKAEKWKIKKEKSKGFQLNLRLDNFNNPEFSQDKYLSDWEMKDDDDNVVGTGNGVYILLLKKKEIPDTFHISICLIRNGKAESNISKFILVRKVN